MAKRDTSRRKPQREPVKPLLIRSTPRGKQTLLDEKCMVHIETALAAGATMQAAAAYAGVGRQTFFDWLRRGRSDRKEGIESEHARFVERIEQAISVCEVDSVMRISAAGQDPRYWTARAWLLERRDPKRWGRVVAVEDRPSEEPPEQMFDFTKLSSEEAATFKALARKAKKQ